MQIKVMNSTLKKPPLTEKKNQIRHKDIYLLEAGAQVFCVVQSFVNFTSAISTEILFLISKRSCFM